MEFGALRLIRFDSSWLQGFGLDEKSEVRAPAAIASKGCELLVSQSCVHARRVKYPFSEEST